MLWRCSRLVLAAWVGLVTASGSAQGGVLAGLPAVYGPGTPQGVPTGETVNVNNDNVGAGNPNRISLVGIDIKGLDPIDIRVPVENSPGASGTTEYFLMLGTAANMTQSAWRGFEIELGSGISDEYLPLGDHAIPGVSGLDFDTPDRDGAVSSTSFPTITHGADLLTFSGGVVPVGGVASAQNFSIDIPDTTTTGNPAYNFTIRLRAIPVSAGDFDVDGDVDGYDFLRWQRDRSVGQLADWEENYDGGSAPRPGDFDGDGDVDGLDFLTWQRNPSVGDLSDWQNNFIGIGPARVGDFDRDGDVDGSDFLTWQRNPSVGALADWQTNYGVGALGALTGVGDDPARSGAVPEPTGLALLVGVAITWWIAIGGGRREWQGCRGR